jgi:hypothetical protein
VSVSPWTADMPARRSDGHVCTGAANAPVAGMLVGSETPEKALSRNRHTQEAVKVVKRIISA